MAASMIRWLGSPRKLSFCKIRGYYRTFLSESYMCDNEWKKCRQTERLNSVKPDLYAVQLLEKFDRERNLSALDVEILATKIPQLKENTVDLARDVFLRFRHSENNLPISDSINHAIIKGYLEMGWIEKLMEMLKNRVGYGIFPDEQIACILLNYFLKRKDYKNAAQVAYEVMLQEEFDHPIRNALALVAAVKHFYHNEGLYRPEPQVVNEDEEIEYIAVKVVHNPYYDDHFDIVDEQFLLGKTLYQLAKAMPDLDTTLSHSLQLLGLGMYNKFKIGDEKLMEWGQDVDSSIVDKYLEYLSEAPTRPEEIPDKPPSQRTMEDEYELKRITEAEKSTFLGNLEVHMDRHQAQFSTISNIEEEVDKYARDIVKKNETNDIEILQERYQKWYKDRQKDLDIQLQEYEIKQKKEEFQEKLRMLQEKEERLSYFEERANILLHKPPVEEEVVKEKVEEVKEDYVEAPGERNVKKGAVKKK